MRTNTPFKLALITSSVSLALASPLTLAADEITTLASDQKIEKIEEN